VNRELALALARNGCEVTVYLPLSTESEREIAAEGGVTLIDAIPIPGVSGAPLLLTQPRLPEGQGAPDAIIGHGRILGPYAYAVRNQFFPAARRVHIVHTDAERLEIAKELPGGESRSTIGQERRLLEVELAASADLVVGVGELLAESIRDEMAAGPMAGPPVETLVPGLTDWPRIADKTNPPKRRHVLIIARADDVRSKGLDLAVRAIARASTQLADSEAQPITLAIRGVPPDHETEVKQRLESIASPNVAIVLRPHSTDPLDLHRDLLLARLVLMPSRHEGFGLAALEAMSVGVPVRVSAESGLARLLRERLPRGDGSPEILGTSASDDEVVEQWSHDICEVLGDPAAAFERPEVALEALRGAHTNWDEAGRRLIAAVEQIVRN
jgi:glycosyltransferase involved in cell wall biosynthesis